MKSDDKCSLCKAGDLWIGLPGGSNRATPWIEAQIILDDIRNPLAIGATLNSLDAIIHEAEKVRLFDKLEELFAINVLPAAGICARLFWQR